MIALPAPHLGRVEGELLLEIVLCLGEPITRGVELADHLIGLALL